MDKKILKENEIKKKSNSIKMDQIGRKIKLNGCFENLKG
jgi:hypothetical protein